METAFLKQVKEYLKQRPPLLLLLVVMTLMVCLVPVYHLLGLLFYLDAPYASPFLKDNHLVNNILLVLHIGAAMPAVFLGPFLFYPSIRRDNLPLHRKMGKWYVTGCLISAVTVFPLALSNQAGTVAHIGFGAMAVIWFSTTMLGYSAIRNKDMVAHRRWMMRSYALTFAFVHVNLTYKLFLPYDEFTVQGVKAFQSMVSWQANLFLVEAYLGLTTHTGRFFNVRDIMANMKIYAPQDRIYLSWPGPVRP